MTKLDIYIDDTSNKEDENKTITITLKEWNKLHSDIKDLNERIKLLKEDREKLWKGVEELTKQLQEKEIREVVV